jgi:DNA-binding MarR family transcriptional regulator
MEELKGGGFLVTKIHQLSQRIFSNLLDKFDIHEITAAQGRILFPLWKQDELSFQELKKKTLLSKSTLSYFLDQLEEAGFIERIHSENDKRIIKIKLVVIDKGVQEKFIGVSNRMKEIYYKNFSEQQINDFEENLNRILRNLMQYNRKKK